MAARAKTGEPIERLLRSVELLLRLKVQEIRGDRNQKQMILLLDGAGATNKEIASLLGVSRTTVAPIVSKARAHSKGQPRNKAASRKL